MSASPTEAALSLVLARDKLNIGMPQWFRTTALSASPALIKRSASRSASRPTIAQSRSSMILPPRKSLIRYKIMPSLRPADYLDLGCEPRQCRRMSEDHNDRDNLPNGISAAYHGHHNEGGEDIFVMSFTDDILKDANADHPYRVRFETFQAMMLYWIDFTQEAVPTFSKIERLPILERFMSDIRQASMTSAAFIEMSAQDSSCSFELVIHFENANDAALLLADMSRLAHEQFYEDGVRTIH